MKKIREALGMLKEKEYFNYSLKDFIMIFFLIVVWTALNSLIWEINNIWSFVLSFGLMAFMVAIAAFLVRKFGIVLLMSLLAVTWVTPLPDLSGMGNDAFLVMFIVGTLFELLYFAFYLESNKIPLDVFLALSLSFATIPLFTSMILSIEIFLARWAEVLNLIFLDLFISVIGIILAFLFWYYTRRTKAVLWFEYNR